MDQGSVAAWSSFIERANRHGTRKTLLSAIGPHRRTGQRFDIRSVGAFPEACGLGADREAAGVEGEVKGEPKTESFGDLRPLRIKGESALGERLDRALVEMLPVSLRALAKLPEDRLQRQQRFIDLGERTADHVEPAVVHGATDCFDPLGIECVLSRYRLRRGQQGNRRTTRERLGQRADWKAGIKEAEIDDVRIHRIEPLPRLREDLERSAEMAHRGGLIS